jgi:hypothetical protein
MKPATTSTACAAALLVGSLPASLSAAPVTCAETLKKIEKQMTDASGRAPVLKIVPKGLAGNARVLASCENGTQRIVQRVETDAGAARADASVERRKPAPAKR